MELAHARLYSHRLEAAVRLAARGHHRQLRKRDGTGTDCAGGGTPLPADCVPYLTHLTGVACILARLGERDEVVAAGLLHDYLEDVPDPDGRERIRREVGEEVLELVLALTESGRDPSDPAGTWSARKQGAIDRVASMQRDAVVIKVADLLHNLSSLLVDLESAASPAAVWSRFNAGPSRQLWYSRGLLAAARQRLGPHPLLTEVDPLLTALEAHFPADSGEAP